MDAVKFWTIDCRLLNEDEFVCFIEDLENYLLTRVDDCALPQKNSEPWLDQFVASYEKWKKRSFRNHSCPLKSYFTIRERHHYRS